ncbi:MAG: NAD-binding protein [Clostridia bacterium]|nr:NAD-binding protein [Clostridia bacterium]
MFVTIASFFRLIHNTFNKNNAYKILIFLTIIILTTSVVFYQCERGAKEGLTFWDSLWWCFVTLATVGYGDYFPVTVPGRLMGIIIMISGIGTFGFFTATVASIFVEATLKKEGGKMDIKEMGHIIVIGWNKKARIIVDELVRENTGQSIVVISKKDKIELEGKNTYFVHGDAMDDRILKKANIEKAALVIVLADEGLESEQMMDARSVLICLAVDKLNPQAHLVSEIMDESNLAHFKRANVDDTVITSQISSKLIVRSALYKHVSDTLYDLMSNDQGHEIYQKKATPKEVGKTFRELSLEYIDKGLGILIGVSFEGGTHVNPEKDYIIHQDDILVLIAKNL